MTKDEARKILLPAMQVTLNQHRGFTLEELAAINTLVAEPAWLDLKTHPLDESMVGQWAWVAYASNGHVRMDKIRLSAKTGLPYLPEDLSPNLEEKILGTHYQLIGPPPEFNKDKGVK